MRPRDPSNYVYGLRVAAGQAMGLLKPLQQTKAAELVHAAKITWYKWEVAGRIPIAEAHLFCVLTGIPWSEQRYEHVHGKKVAKTSVQKGRKKIAVSRPIPI